MPSDRERAKETLLVALADHVMERTPQSKDEVRHALGALLAPSHKVAGGFRTPVANWGFTLRGRYGQDVWHGGFTTERDAKRARELILRNTWSKVGPAVQL